VVRRVGGLGQRQAPHSPQIDPILPLASPRTGGSHAVSAPDRHVPPERRVHQPDPATTSCRSRHRPPSTPLGEPPGGPGAPPDGTRRHRLTSRKQTCTRRPKSSALTRNPGRPAGHSNGSAPEPPSTHTEPGETGPASDYRTGSLEFCVSGWRPGSPGQAEPPQAAPRPAPRGSPGRVEPRMQLIPLRGSA